MAKTEKNYLSPPNQLIIFQPDNIGDYIVFTALLQNIRKVYPSSDWKITLIGNRIWQNLIEPHIADIEHKDKWINEFIPLNMGRGEKNLFFGSDILSDLNNLFIPKIYPNIEKTKKIDIIVSLARADYRMGYIRKILRKGRPQKINNKCHEKSFIIKNRERHELEVFRELLKKLGFKAKSPLKTKVTWDINDEEVVTQIIKQKKSYFVISPYANNPLKNWPVEKLNILVRWLKSAYGHLIYFVGTNDKKKMIDEEFVSKSSGGIYNLAGRLTLRQAACLLGSAKLVISPDSMLAHMAIATKTPLICLLGGMHFGHFFPYPFAIENIKVHHLNWDCFLCNYKCKYNAPPAPCVAQIEVDSVKESVQSLLKGQK